MKVRPQYGAAGSVRRVARLGVVSLLLATLTACGVLGNQKPEPAPRPTVKQVDAPPAAPEPVTPPAAAQAPSLAATTTPPASTVSELQGMIQSREVAELRTAYNGSYGASLLFNAETLTYYAALFQQKNFWRIVKTSSERQAEAAYRSFVAQSAELAEVDLRRIRLQAENALAERTLSTRSELLSTLQADESVREQQAREVQTRQAQSREQANALAQQQKQAREELRAIQAQIDALQRRQQEIGSGKRGK
ncbi:DUF2968 domain-containing protein [Schauerella aestuarii]|uniref:DUF2968 domain-containing protein n=1 Tax=Schauerella aestuarii TaxID=2511204 RepID=UPI00136C28BB|nr:DUF2968 domain-containing protein [Achromobacter aestuarii]MYZ45355.1 DUF2968 domain-containing protein [Achromobacter aestuarii]